MRFDQTVYFCRGGEKVYDPKTGRTTKGKTTKVPKMAHVSDEGDESMALLYGHLEEGAKQFIFKEDWVPDFDFLEYKGKRYSATRVNARHRTMLRGKEIQ